MDSPFDYFQDVYIYVIHMLRVKGRRNLDFFIFKTVSFHLQQVQDIKKVKKI